MLHTAACNAQAAWIECRGCDEWSAKTTAKEGLAPATRIVFDAGANSAWKFDVVREQIGQNCQVEGMVDPNGGRRVSAANGEKANPGLDAFGQCQWANVAYPRSLDSDEVETLELLRLAFVETGGTWEKAIVISRDDITIMPCGYCLVPSGSGYDVVNDVMFMGQVRIATQAYMRSLQGAISSLARIVVKGIEIHFLGAGPEMTYIVVFADGTRVAVEFNDQSPDGKIEPGNITDENGHPLMNQSNMNTFQHFGTVYGSDEAVESFLRNAERLGVPIERAGGRTVSCTWKCENTSTGASCNMHCSSQ